MAGKLAHRTALVTGGGRGIGEAICRVFAREGAQVAVADIDAGSAERTAASLPTQGLALPMDVASKAAVTAGCGQVVEEFGHLDILVNNAGFLKYTTFEECSEELWDRTVDTNMKGTFLCIQAILPHMKERGQGNIINITSLAVKTGGPAAGPPYAASKAGIFVMTIGLAKECAPHRIRVNGIAPGVIDTPMTQSPQHDEFSKLIPLGEKGQPEDIANCALFLGSDDSRHITGEIIDVNGGLFMD